MPSSEELVRLSMKSPRIGGRSLSCHGYDVKERLIRGGKERLSREEGHLASSLATGRLLADDWRGPVKAAMNRRPRLVDKDGSTLLLSNNLPHKFRATYRATCRNWFHLVIECSWRSISLLFALGFFASWTFFGICYYFITRFYSTLNKEGKIDYCIANVVDFTTAFLFSMESQHTIGYGTRFMKAQCTSAIITLCFQLVVGVFLQTILAGIVIAKVLRPKKRKQEMRFSRTAVIGPLSEHDKRLALMVRLADTQERLFLAESHVRMYMATTKINQRGDRELIGLKDINVGYDNGWDRVLLLWPIIVRHVIDENSPLHGMSKDVLFSSDFELIMTVEGIVEATGMTFQARTSFLPEEIQWGYKFAPMVTLNEKQGKYEVHYSLFDQIEKVDVADVVEVEDEEDSPLLPHNASGFV